jgi:hypothetical protein
MPDYASDKLVAVDIDLVMRDEALVAMPDGPAKRFLRDLAVKLDHDADHPPPQLLVRRGP